ncbi:MAG: pilus assembly protein [Chloroflexi bacterium]|nr:pilus assembly protein [Chloroflexota bacterium]
MKPLTLFLETQDAPPGDWASHDDAETRGAASLLSAAQDAGQQTPAARERFLAGVALGEGMAWNRLKRMTPRQPHGQSLVEFGLFLVILLVLLAGLVDAGRGLFTFMALREAAQEGALYGALHPSDTADIQQRVLRTSTLVESMAAELTVTPTVTGGACTGGAITVEVTYANFRIAMPFLGAILGSQTIPIRARVTDTILTPPCP